MTYTAVAFSFVTVLTAMDLDIQSVSYIDYREFPGGDSLSPGPHGYLDLVNSNAINIVPNTMFLLNSWLTEGLLVSCLSKSITRMSNPAAPSALSLLCHLRDELLGRYLPMPDVPRFFGYVLESSVGRRLHSQLTSLMQRRVSHSSTTRPRSQSLENGVLLPPTSVIHIL